MSYVTVILSYNHPELTEKCIQSALEKKHSKQSNQDIFLVHNGSEKKFSLKLQNQFPDITHIFLEQNKGFSGGANYGIKKAFEKSEHVLFLTNDCELFTAAEIPAVSSYILAPKIYTRKFKLIDSIGAQVDLISARPQHLKEKEQFKKSTRKNNYTYVPGSAFLIDKQAFEKLNGFDESLETYWEDIDLGIRANKKGVNLLSNENLVIHHKIGKTCHKNSHYTTYLYQRNRKRISRKYIVGFLPRCTLELNLMQTWLKLFFIFIKHKRYTDIQKLFKAIFETSTK